MLPLSDKINKSNELEWNNTTSFSILKSAMCTIHVPSTDQPCDSPSKTIAVEKSINLIYLCCSLEVTYT